MDAPSEAGAAEARLAPGQREEDRPVGAGLLRLLTCPFCGEDRQVERTPDGGFSVDLTGMNEELILRDKDGALVTVAGTTRIDGTPTTGKVYFKPATGDLLNSKSPYRLHWKITDGAGDVVFFPNGAPDSLVVYRP